MLKKLRTDLKVYSNAEKDMILRDELAVDRTHMANTRTLLSAIRSGLYFLVTGLTLMAVPNLDEFHFLMWPFFAVGVAIWIWGVTEFVQMKRKLRDCDPS